jgi:hypothetical protein
MDYFLLFWDLGYRNIKILIQEDIKKEMVYDAWEDKYILPEDYQKYIVFSKSKIIISKDILIFTGGLYKNYIDESKLIYKKLLIMRCEPFFNYNSLKDLKLKNFVVLEDQRIYKKYRISVNSKHYIKKIYFKRYKNLEKPVRNKTLIYINTNLRFIELPEKEDKNILYVSGDTDTTGTFPEYVLKAPVPKLFNKFNKFLYTKTTRSFDCSSRLITECKFYNKEVLWNFNFEEYSGPDYGDTGLYWRNYDIQNNFKSLELTEKDDICYIINQL